MSGRTDPRARPGNGPGVEGALAAGERVRDALEEYRAAFGAAARELAREAGDSADRRTGFEALRMDWESTVTAFRDAVDRIGTAQKTLARGR